MWGLRDPAFGPEYLARWQRLFPRAHTIELASCGHFPAEEAPDALADAIRACG